MLALTRPRNVLAAGAALAVLVAGFFVVHPGGARSSSSARLVGTAKNATLSRTILVNSKGLSLYALSVEWAKLTDNRFGFGVRKVLEFRA